MALTPGVASSTDPSPNEAEGQHIDAPELRLFVMALFFIFGGITSLNDVIIPKLKELFTLNYTQAMLVQFCFFTAYAVIGLPGAALVKKLGYMRGAVAGLLAMMVGCQGRRRVNPGRPGRGLGGATFGRGARRLSRGRDPHGGAHLPWPRRGAGCGCGRGMDEPQPAEGRAA